MLPKQTQNNCSLRSAVSLQQCQVLWAEGHDFQGQQSYKPRTREAVWKHPDIL